MSVSGPNIERNPGDNDLDYSLAIEPLVDLAIENAHFERLVVGRTTLLQLAVENLGPNEPASKVTLRNDLPAGLEYTEAVGDDWECATSGQRLECSYREALVVGEPLPVVEVGVRVLSTDADGEENVSRVSATVRDADVGNNEARTVWSPSRPRRAPTPLRPSRPGPPTTSPNARRTSPSACTSTGWRPSVVVRSGISPSPTPVPAMRTTYWSATLCRSTWHPLT
jgi:hypothetical protein